MKSLKILNIVSLLIGPLVSISSFASESVTRNYDQLHAIQYIEERYSVSIIEKYTNEEIDKLFNFDDTLTKTMDEKDFLKIVSKMEKATDALFDGKSCTEKYKEAKSHDFLRHLGALSLLLDTAQTLKEHPINKETKMDSILLKNLSGC